MGRQLIPNFKQAYKMLSYIVEDCVICQKFCMKEFTFVLKGNVHTNIEGYVCRRKTKDSLDKFVLEDSCLLTLKFLISIQDKSLVSL